MKRTHLLRWIGPLLSLSLFLLAAMPAAALTPAYPITGSYLSSTYHDNLIKLPRMGDRAFDTVAVALSQLDYHEGNSTADFDGEKCRNAIPHISGTKSNAMFCTNSLPIGKSKSVPDWCEMN